MNLQLDIFKCLLLCHYNHYCMPNFRIQVLKNYPSILMIAECATKKLNLDKRCELHKNLIFRKLIMFIRFVTKLFKNNLSCVMKTQGNKKSFELLLGTDMSVLAQLVESTTVLPVGKSGKSCHITNNCDFSLLQSRQKISY